MRQNAEQGPVSPRVALVALILLVEGIAHAKEPKLYKLRFREGAEHCAVVRIPDSWQYRPDRLPDELTPGRWELRKDATAPAPGYLLRWNGELGYVPANYSNNVFRFEWTSDKPVFFPVAPERWAAASRMKMSWWGNKGTHVIGGDDPTVTVEGRSFERTGKHWNQSYSDAILTSDKKWLVLQSTDGKIINRTLFGEGPGLPLDGPIHVDVYWMQTGKRYIRLKIKQSERQDLSYFLNNAHIYEDRYLFLRVDPRGKQMYYLVCKLPAEP
ncbi:MAG: hypothetical protein J0H49_35330 [Acidobacteria bacterium]|nr:hypothetical protein [Acidobacteriota bacterium]